MNAVLQMLAKMLSHRTSQNFVLLGKFLRAKTCGKGTYNTNCLNTIFSLYQFALAASCACSVCTLRVEFPASRKKLRNLRTYATHFFLHTILYPFCDGRNASLKLPDASYHRLTFCSAKGSVILHPCVEHQQCNLHPQRQSRLLRRSRACSRRGHRFRQCCRCLLLP